MHEVEVEIDACPEHVWAVLADVARWPGWARGVTSAAALDGGPLVVGGRVRVRARRQGTRTWRVTALAPYRGFTWSATVTGWTDVLTVALRPLDAGAAAPAGRAAAAPGRRTRLSMSLRRAGRGVGLAALRPGGTRSASAAHLAGFAADLRGRCEQRRRGAGAPATVTAAATATRPVGRPV